MRRGGCETPPPRRRAGRARARRCPQALHAPARRLRAGPPRAAAGGGSACFLTPGRPLPRPPPPVFPPSPHFHRAARWLRRAHRTRARARALPRDPRCDRPSRPPKSRRRARARRPAEAAGRPPAGGARGAGTACARAKAREPVRACGYMPLPRVQRAAATSLAPPSALPLVPQFNLPRPPVARPVWRRPAACGAAAAAAGPLPCTPPPRRASRARRGPCPPPRARAHARIGGCATRTATHKSRFSLTLPPLPAPMSALAPRRAPQGGVRGGTEEVTPQALAPGKIRRRAARAKPRRGPLLAAGTRVERQRAQNNARFVMHSKRGREQTRRRFASGRRRASAAGSARRRQWPFEREQPWRAAASLHCTESGMNYQMRREAPETQAFTRCEGRGGTNPAARPGRAETADRPLIA